MKDLGKFLIVVIGGSFDFIYKGFVVSIMWGWFMVPLGVMKINTITMAGLFIILSLIKGVGKIEKDPNISKVLLTSFVHLQ